MDLQYLGYVFSNEAVSSPNEIQRVDSYDAMMEKLDSFQNQYPLFVHFLSGLIPQNGRPWCPYCERSDVLYDYNFNHSAPSNAVLLKVVVAESYEEWHREDNRFRLNSSLLGLNGIPSVSMIHRDETSGKLNFAPFKSAVTEKKKMQSFFGSSTSHHIIVNGYQAAVEYLLAYDIATSGPLYLFFSAKPWCGACDFDQVKVLEARSRSPLKPRVLEIHVGSKEEWENDQNLFRMQKIFYIDFLPTLLRWNGQNHTSLMLNEADCANPKLLDYVFEVAEPKTTNRIETISSHDQLRQFLDEYNDQYPLFLHAVSGIDHGRAWCPYCDKSNIRIDYYFNTTAAEDAVMLNLIVAETYDDWQLASNPYHKSELLTIPSGIPALFRARRVKDTATLQMIEFKRAFENVTALESFFSGIE